MWNSEDQQHSEVAMDNAEAYIELYKQLEHFAMGKYNYPENGTAVYRLSQRSEYASFRSDLDYCRAVRAVLQHRPRFGNNYPVQPCNEMIDFLRATIDKVKNPPKVMDSAVPISSILFKSMDNLVLPTMFEMQEKIFTHIPILRDGVVIGVFSENTLLSYLSDERIVEIADNMRFADLAEYLPLEKHKAESFRFVKPTKPIYEIRTLFDNALKNQDHIGLVFITKNGRPEEPLQGILTAWDIAAVQ